MKKKERRGGGEDGREFQSPKSSKSFSGHHSWASVEYNERENEALSVGSHWTEGET